MSDRLVCLQGHWWEDGDATISRVAEAAFCPTCGLRLYSEDEAPTIPVAAQRLLCSDPTPFTTGVLPQFNRGSTDNGSITPTIQPNDIEAIPGYELLGILGRGGMGIVFRARQLSLKRQVALKMILSGRHARPTERARFQREAEAVARLQHPNIVQIYEVGEQNGLPYFSLEFVNAGSLAQFLQGNQQPSNLSAQFVLDLARAMHYAHKRGIVHRDLKPANILLQLDESQILKNGQMTEPRRPREAERGEREREAQPRVDTAIFRDLPSYVPKITDFGLAKHMGGEDGLARPGPIVGTPSYMAPEQAHQHSDAVIGPQADVYALGAILYEMVTGRPPFLGTTAEETAQQVLSFEPVPPTQLQPKIPRDLETICLVCLQKDPVLRYSSAEALAEDLRRFLGNEPILARRTALPERVVKWAVRRPLIAALSIGGLALTSLLWWIWWQKAVTFRAEREEIFQAWQQSEQNLQNAIATIDQLSEAGAASGGETESAALLRARQFYERLLQQGGPPARMAGAAYRLGRVQERLGEPQTAVSAYLDAIARWEKLDETERPEFRTQLQYARQRIQALTAKPRT
jgi:serine/threonine-protein kinase